MKEVIRQTAQSQARACTDAEFRQLRRDVCRRALDRLVDKLVRSMDYADDDDDLRAMMKTAIVQHASSFKDVYGS